MRLLPMAMVALLALPSCTHITVSRGSMKESASTTTQTRKVNYLFWTVLNMQRAASARDVCYPLTAEGFTIGMDSMDWLLSAATLGFYVQQTVNYRCSPLTETKKVSKNQ